MKREVGEIEEVEEVKDVRDSDLLSGEKQSVPQRLKPTVEICFACRS